MSWREKKKVPWKVLKERRRCISDSNCNGLTMDSCIKNKMLQCKKGSATGKKGL
jgi:hypothetical protein